jgi:hypothetical protein
MAEQFFVNSATPSGSGRFYTELDTNQGKFWYVPQEFVQKGLRKGDKQYLEQSFLNKDYLNTFKPIKLDESLVTKQLKNAGYQDPSTGVLISDADFKKYDKNAVSVTSYSAVNKFAGPVQGIAERDGNLVYSFAGAGGSTYGYLDSKGTPTEVTVTQPKRKLGKLGEIATDVAGAFASIPYLPEIVGYATGNPVLYGTLKSLQTAGQGGDLKDVLKSGATAAATALAVKSIIGSPTTSGVEPGAGVEVYPVDAGVTPDITSIPGTPSLPPVDYGLLGDASLPTAAPGMGGGTNAYDAGVGLDVMNPPPAAPTMTAEQLAASNIDPLTREGMSAEQITKEAINSPYYGAAQSNIDPSILEGMSAEQVASAPVLTSAGLASGAAASTIGLSDAIRGLRTANSLLNPPSAGGGGGGGDQGGAQQSMAGVDYSGLYNLLAQRAIVGGLLGTQYQPQPVNLASLLG